MNQNSIAIVVIIVIVIIVILITTNSRKCRNHHTSKHVKNNSRPVKYRRNETSCPKKQSKSYGHRVVASHYPVTKSPKPFKSSKRVKSCEFFSPNIPNSPTCDINETFVIPCAQEIYDMHFQHRASLEYTAYFQEIIKDVTVPLPSILDDQFFPIFGYDQNDNLVLDGGEQYNYTTPSKVRIHGLHPDDEKFIKIETAARDMKKIISYLAERGFSLHGPDTTKSNKDSFQNVLQQRMLPSGGNTNEDTKFSIKPVYNGGGIATHIAFGVAHVIDGHRGGFTEFEPNLDFPNLGDNRDVRLAYPMRIPLLDGDEYKSWLVS